MPNDDGGGDDADAPNSANPEPAAAPAKPQSPPTAPSRTRKSVSYSQPLGRDAAIFTSAAAASSSSTASRRKHSLDESDRVRAGAPPLSLPPHNLTLERAMSDEPGPSGALPEFVGSGGGKGMFRVPLRAAMHPDRPPPLVLRSHPLRETQAGAFLRTLAFCSERGQLWAGAECGMRVWRLEDVYTGWAASASPRHGDEQTVPFKESAPTPPVTCFVIDAATEMVWSGHKDGKIRAWRLENGEGRAPAAGGKPFKERITWQAHNRTPVLSMAMTSYGEIWTGSEGGVIRVWPWETIYKSLNLQQEERHMAALLIERSYIDLRSQVTVNGVCPLSFSDVKHMLADNCSSKVWTVTSMTFALWDAQKRELLKVLGMDGQVETAKLEPPIVQENDEEDEMKLKFASSSKRDRSQGPFTFLQRSRNAFFGAADAVRRVATKGTLIEDNRRTGAISLAMDGTIWSGCTNGSIFLWDGNGTRLQEFQHHNSFVQCICAYGERVWVGYASGTIQVMGLDGSLLGEWVANSCPVIKLAVGGSYIFSLAHHGGIRGWLLSSPGPLDDVLRTEIAKRESSYMRLEKLRILVGTWNVGQEKASHDSLISWLGSAVSDVGLVVVGLQEVEMGAGFLAMSAAKETVGLEGSAIGQWWIDTIGKNLDEGSSFQRIGSRQLAALLICSWARKNIRPHIGDVDAAIVACGFGRAIGNKGAVSLRMRVYDRIICFLCCHFAAHLEAVSKRNADFDHVYRTMTYNRLNGAAAAATSVQLHRTANVTFTQPTDGKPELSEADMIVFLGDFNYRLGGITYDEARDMVSQRSFDWLREKDQLRAEMKAGRVFQGMREGQIKFPPTYKFQRNQPGLSGYDSGEKKRIPAWCDRILYRDNRIISVAECSLQCPVVASIATYEACMDVTESDHKPVRCIYNVEIAHVDELIRRQEYGEIIESNEKIRSLIREAHVVPNTVVSTNNIIFANQDKITLRITNESSSHKAVFRIMCEGQTTINEDGSSTDLCYRGSFGFPLWVEVTPAIGIIKPKETFEVTVNHQDFCEQEEYVDGIPQKWWCEDTRDKSLVLLVVVTGTGSTTSMTHRIDVQHCQSYEPKNSSANTRAANSNQSIHIERSDFTQFGSSEVNELRHLRGL